MRAVLLGAAGQLSHDLLPLLAAWDVLSLNHADLDIYDDRSVRQRLSQFRPNIVINTAAYHRVDECEEQIAKTFEINTYAVRHLAHVCSEIGSVLVHVSTDYVFGSSRRRPHSEEDTPEPLSVYGVSKLAGEYFVRSLCKKHFVIRSAGLYGVAGASGKGGNFVETMLRLAKENKKIRVVADQILTPTYTKDLAKKMYELMQTDSYGLYHITNAGECSWYEFASKIFELTKLKPDLGPTTTAAFGARAQRPAYSVLSNQKLRLQGFQPLRSWQGALADYLAEKKHLA